MDRRYFASLPTDEIGKELYSRVENFYKYVETSGFFKMVKKAYYAYYGSSYEMDATGRVFESSSLRRDGVQGELYNIKINELRNLIQHLLVMTTSERPQLTAQAGNTDYRSQAQSELGDALLDYYLVEKRVERTLVSAAETALVTSGAYVEVGWDTSAGKEYGRTDDGRIIYNGDLDFKVYNPLDVIFDIYKDSRKTAWKTLRRWENRYDLAATYPEKEDEILMSGSKDAGNAYYTFANKVSMDEADDIAVFYFYHEKTPSVPNGRLVIFLEGGEVLFDGPLPYKRVQIFNICPAQIINTPWGYTPAFDLLGPQDIIDHLHSTATSNLITFGTQLVWLPRGHGINVQDLGKGLAVIETDPKVGKPEGMNLTQTPSELFKYLETVQSRAEALAGLNSVVRGNPEGQLTRASGAAMALLASQSIQFNQGLQREYEFLCEDVGTAMIDTLRLYAKTPRVALISGINKRSYLREFNADDMGDIERVVVKRQSAISRTTAGKVEIARELLQQGMVKTPEEYMSVLKTGNLETMIEGPRSEVMLIKSENERLRQGSPDVMLVDTDNHMLHITEHKTILDSVDARENPDVVEAVLAHIQEHVNALGAVDPNLLMLLGQQPLQTQEPQGGATAPVPGGQQGPPPAPEGPSATQGLEPSQLPEGMPGMPSMPTNPLSGQEFEPASPEAQEQMAPAKLKSRNKPKPERIF